MILVHAWPKACQSPPKRKCVKLKDLSLHIGKNWILELRIDFFIVQIKSLQGGCCLQDLSISQVIDHVTCYKLSSLIG